MSAITSGLTSRLDALLLFGCCWLLLPAAEDLACWELAGFELIGLLAAAVFLELKELIAFLGFEFCAGLVFPFPPVGRVEPTG